MPDHLNRSRFPVNMTQQNLRPVSVTTIPNDSWMVGAPEAPAPPTKPTSHASYFPFGISQNACTPRQSRPSLSPECTSESTEMPTSHSPSCVTPENVNPNDFWDEGNPL